jgi:hypothetical protein
MTIEETLRTNRPNLSAGSVRTYASILKNLAKQMKVELDSPSAVVKNYKAILDHLKETPPKLRKTRLASLIVFVVKHDGAEKALNAFREQMMGDGKKSDDDAKEQTMTDKQKENWMDWEVVLEKYEALKKEVTPLLRMDKLDKKQFARVQLFVLLSLMVLIPPRRSLDWTAFVIHDIDKEKDNYLGTVKRKPMLVFNNYKTAGKTGQQTVEVPKDLHQILKRWMVLNPHDFLLMNYGQTGGITPTQLVQLLYGFFGKNVSTSMIRKIYLTNKYKDIPALKEMEATAEAMGQSLGEALKSYVKRDAPSHASE